MALLLSFLIAMAVNAAFFAIAATRKTDVVTDLSYSLTFALLAVVLLIIGAREPSQLIASLLVLLWAIRLGGYLFRRILRMKVDHRFDGMRDKPRRFARFWLLQALAVAVIRGFVSSPAQRLFRCLLGRNGRVSTSTERPPASTAAA